MFGIRGDVHGMKAIIRDYLSWTPRSAFLDEAKVAIFAHYWFEKRYSIPIGSQEHREILHQICQVAFPIFSEELNYDGTPSLFAILGSICEAERVQIDIQVVAKKCRKLFGGEIAGKVLGGIGIADIPQAFRNGTRRYNEARAEIERRFL